MGKDKTYFVCWNSLRRLMEKSRICSTLKCSYALTEKDKYFWPCFTNINKLSSTCDVNFISYYVYGLLIIFCRKKKQFNLLGNNRGKYFVKNIFFDNITLQRCFNLFPLVDLCKIYSVLQHYLPCNMSSTIATAQCVWI